MRHFFKLALIITLAITTIIALGCGDDDPAPPVASEDPPPQGDPSDEQMSIDHVTGLTVQNHLVVGDSATFHIRLNNATEQAIVGLTLGFRIYSPNGATWNTTIGSHTGTITDDHFDGGTFVMPFNTDGSGADTIGFGGFKMVTGSGIPVGFDQVTFRIDIGPIGIGSFGKTICIDSSWYFPGGTWLWSLGGGGGGLSPTWDGPTCYNIVSGG